MRLYIMWRTSAVHTQETGNLKYIYVEYQNLFICVCFGIIIKTLRLLPNEAEAVVVGAVVVSKTKTDVQKNFLNGRHSSPSLSSFLLNPKYKPSPEVSKIIEKVIPIMIQWFFFRARKLSVFCFSLLLPSSSSNTSSASTFMPNSYDNRS